MRIWAPFWGLLFLNFTWLAGPGNAAENTLKGVMFADYYYIASGTSKEENGFRFRRIYLTHDLKWNDGFSGRVRLEAKDGGFGSGKKMEPFVKHAYLRYRKNGQALYMGLSGTPLWNVSERVWGYRSVEKTIMDLYKIGSSADIGLSYHGRLDSDGKINTQIMLANGKGQASETDNDKRMMGLLHFRPGSFEATVYADWENRAGDTDRMTFAGFVGRVAEAFHGGIEGFVQVRKNPAGDVQVRGLSAFCAGQINEKTRAFGRVDFYDPSDKAGGDRIYLFIGGIDLSPAQGVHFMPNVWARAFQAPGVDAEIIPRMTIYVKF